MKRNTRGVKTLSSYLTVLCLFMANLLEGSEKLITEFLSSDVINSIMLCLNSTIPETRINSFRVILYLSKEKLGRGALEKFDVFNSVMHIIYEEAEKHKKGASNIGIIGSAVGALAHFTKDHANKVLLMQA